MTHRLRAIVQNVLEGLRAGADVLLWGQAYPRTFPVHSSTPRADTPTREADPITSTDDAFWAQVEGDTARTILCEPHRFDELQAIISERGYTHLTLRSSQFCPPGKLLVLDEMAMEAGWQQTIQRAGRSLHR